MKNSKSFSKKSIEDIIDFDRNNSGNITLIRPFYINFNSEINNNSVDKFINILNNQIREYLFIKKKMGVEIPINIFFTTKGGNILDGFALISKMKEMEQKNIKFKFIAKGYVFSMGLAIYLSIKNRKSEEHTLFGTTPVSGNIYGDVETEDNKEASYYEMMLSKLFYTFKNCTSLNDDHIHELLYSEKIFNSESELNNFLTKGCTDE